MFKIREKCDEAYDWNRAQWLGNIFVNTSNIALFR